MKPPSPVAKKPTQGLTNIALLHLLAQSLTQTTVYLAPLSQDPPSTDFEVVKAAAASLYVFREFVDWEFIRCLLRPGTSLFGPRWHPVTASKKELETRDLVAQVRKQLATVIPLHDQLMEVRNLSPAPVGDLVWGAEWEGVRNGALDDMRTDSSMEDGAADNEKPIEKAGTKKGVHLAPDVLAVSEDGNVNEYPLAPASASEQMDGVVRESAAQVHFIASTPAEASASVSMNQMNSEDGRADGATAFSVAMAESVIGDGTPSPMVVEPESMSSFSSHHHDHHEHQAGSEPLRLNSRQRLPFDRKGQWYLPVPMSGFPGLRFEADGTVRVKNIERLTYRLGPGSDGEAYLVHENPRLPHLKGKSVAARITANGKIVIKGAAFPLGRGSPGQAFLKKLEKRAWQGSERGQSSGSSYNTATRAREYENTGNYSRAIETQPADPMDEDDRLSGGPDGGGGRPLPRNSRAPRVQTTWRPNPNGWSTYSPVSPLLDTIIGQPGQPGAKPRAGPAGTDANDDFSSPDESEMPTSVRGAIVEEKGEDENEAERPRGEKPIHGVTAEMRKHHVLRVKAGPADNIRDEGVEIEKVIRFRVVVAITVGSTCDNFSNKHRSIM